MKDNTSYFDEQTVLYAAGNNVVIFNTEQKSQKFIPGTEKSEGITALAVSPNRKYVAVAERGVEGEKVRPFNCIAFGSRDSVCSVRGCAVTAINGRPTDVLACVLTVRSFPTISCCIAMPRTDSLHKLD